ncbi:Tbingi protein [Trypanosoma theileri]|uniref:Tbingi protein n=1 Tax=Trypanosoma theileri TaxID=67003 RepID=A0A1X0NES5_9TRYP|nr:Tbingi protein [Trypanosoma theileri]ORC82254.1 Tbingi protein [Trypanosoma theileri]
MATLYSQHWRLHLAHTTRHGPSASDVTISRECLLESWTASFSPESDHYIILFEVAVGDDDEPLRFPRPRTPIYAWKKAKWSRFRYMSNAQCDKRLKEKQSVHKRERLLTSAIQIATAAAVPRGDRDTTPYWIPELEEIEEKIHNCKPYVSRDRLVVRRRELPRQASHKRWKTLCNNMSVEDGCCWNILKRIYAPCPLRNPAIKIKNTALT